MTRAGNLLPIVDELAAMKTDAGRAIWLLSVPLAHLVTYREQIAEICKAAGFLQGVVYLDRMMTVMNSVRGDMGGLKQPAVDTAFRANMDLQRVVDRGGRA